MPAKSKAKAAQAAATAKMPPPATAPVTALGQAALDVNSKYAMALQAATTTMMEHHVFVGMGKNRPQQLSQAPFTDAAFAAAMANKSKVFRCAGNALWVKVVTPTSMPIREKKVTQVQQAYFPQPTEVFPLVLTVGLVESALTVVDYKILPNAADNFGKLELISPCEVLHALIFRIAEDIQKGMADEDLQIWRTCLLNASMEFKVLMHMYILAFRLRPRMFQGLGAPILFDIVLHHKHTLCLRNEIIYLTVEPATAIKPKSLVHVGG